MSDDRPVVGSGRSGGHEKSTTSAQPVGESRNESRSEESSAGCGSDLPVPAIAPDYIETDEEGKPRGVVAQAGLPKGQRSRRRGRRA